MRITGARYLLLCVLWIPGALVLGRLHDGAWGGPRAGSFALAGALGFPLLELAGPALLNRSGLAATAGAMAALGIAFPVLKETTRGKWGGTSGAATVLALLAVSLLLVRLLVASGEERLPEAPVLRNTPRGGSRRSLVRVAYLGRWRILAGAALVALSLASPWIGIALPALFLVLASSLFLAGPVCAYSGLAALPFGRWRAFRVFLLPALAFFALATLAVPALRIAAGASPVPELAEGLVLLLAVNLGLTAWHGRGWTAVAGLATAGLLLLPVELLPRSPSLAVAAGAGTAIVLWLHARAFLRLERDALRPETLAVGRVW